jgi:hypothetical protein
MDWRTKLGDQMQNFGTQIVFEHGEYRAMDDDDQKLLSEIIALELYVREHGTITTMPVTADRQRTWQPLGESAATGL